MACVTMTQDVLKAFFITELSSPVYFSEITLQLCNLNRLFATLENVEKRMHFYLSRISS